MLHHFHFAIPRGASLEGRRNVRAHILKTYGIDGTSAGAIRFLGERDYGHLYVIDTPETPAAGPWGSGSSAGTTSPDTETGAGP